MPYGPQPPPSIPPASPPAGPQRAGAPTLQLLLPQQGASGIQEDLGTSHLVLLESSDTPERRAPPWGPLAAQQHQGGEGKKGKAAFFI